MICGDAELKRDKKSDKAGFWWLAAFLIIFILSILYALRSNVTEYYYDSRNYWNLANDLFYDGPEPINILKFPKSIRGYFFPILTGYFKYFFPGVWGWRILVSLSMAFCFSLSLPYAIGEKPIRSLVDVIRSLLAFTVYMWIWGDYSQYPLTDFSSCFYLLSAIAFLRCIRKDHKPLIQAVFGLCAGVFLYAAYNTRPTFLYSAVIVFAAFILINRKRSSVVLISMAGILTGMLIFALPQCYINNRHDSVFSPLVNYDLVDNEVFKGLTTSRYETYIGDPDVYPRSALIFDDLTGWQIIRREKLSAGSFRLYDIFPLFLKYPLDMAGIYVRHLLSLLTPVYRQVYVTDIYAFEPVTAVVSMVLWLIAGFGILERIKAKGTDLNALWILSVCVPGLLQIFDEPELRFFLPIYILCYYYVFAVIDHKSLLRSFKSNRIPVLLISLLILVLWITLTGNILASKRDGALLFFDGLFFKF